VDISALAPDIAKLFGIAPSTLVLLFLIVTMAARALARSIPDDAVGGWAVLRKLAAIIGAEVASKVTSGVTVSDVARASLQVPPIPQVIAADAEAASGTEKL
jgi:hypothetical protein